MLLTFIIIFVLGYIGYRIFHLLHFPGATVTGALVILAIISSQGVQWAEIPVYLTTFFQVIIGIMIGSKFSKEKLSMIQSLLIPGLLTSAWMIGFSLGIGLLLAKYTGIELGSALYGSVPGGLSEMGLIALACNLNVPTVTLLQFVRVISVNLGVPLIASKCNQMGAGKNGAECQKPNGVNAIEGNVVEKIDKSNGKTDLFNINILATLLIGAAGGFTAKYFGVPVGGMLGAMLMVAILRVIGLPLKELPRWMVITAQISLGGYLGTTFTPEMVHTLQSLLFPILLFSMIIVLNGILIGFVIHQILGWDLVTSLLATAAGGVTIMTITALEMNADSIKVSIFHALRLVIILLVMPTMISYIIR